MANGLEGLAPNLWQKVRRLLEPESGAETVGLIGASMMPGVGEAIDIADIAAGIQDRDLGRIGLGAVGLALPFISGRTIRGARDLARAGDTPPGWGPKAITPPPVKGLEALDNSRLEKFFLDTQQGKATGSQWQGMLNKAPGGIPKGEMEWTGITKLLSDNPSRKFTRAELQKHMDDRGIKLKETWRSHTKTPYEGWDSARFETELSRLEAEAHWQRQLGNSAEESRLWGEIDQMTRAEEEMIGIGAPGTPKFVKNRIEGPSKNYRELTVELDPQLKKYDSLMMRRKNMGTGYESTASMPFKMKAEYDALTKQIKSLPAPTRFTQSHWDEANVLVHMRMSDRVGVNPKTGKPEKVLFLEEIQSDWHQKGRDRGYWDRKMDDAFKAKEMSAKDALNALENKHGMSISEAMQQRGDVARGLKGLDIHPHYRHLTPGSSPAAPPRPGSPAARRLAEKRRPLIAEQKRLDGIIDEFTVARSKLDDLFEIKWKAQADKVVEGPFKDTDEWVGLGMRRAIQEGVDGGYDRIAWGTGEQVAEMFDLRKHVSKIEYDQNIKSLKAWGLDGDRIISETGITPEQLPDYIGKEPAERLLAQDSAGIVADDYVITELKDSRGLPMFRVEGPYAKTHVTSREAAERFAENFAEDFNSRIRIIEGDDLAVGGEDMLYFYDKIVPNAIKKEGKKLGGIKIERIGLGQGSPQSFAITPEMRNMAGRSGQRLWGTGGLVGLGLAARQQRHRVTTNG